MHIEIKEDEQMIKLNDSDSENGFIVRNPNNFDSD